MAVTLASPTIRLRDLRNGRPQSLDGLWHWVAEHAGVELVRSASCRHHHAPFDVFAAQYDGPLVDRADSPASLSLVLGARGSGKSFDAALLTHLASRFNPGYGTRVLGGSKAQSEQIYNGIAESVWGGPDADTIKSLLRESATYHNGSKVSILAASQTSVRGPHVPSLRLDEVDEIDPDIRQAALGMAMEDRRRGYRAQVAMTSTWHRMGGPMGELVERAKGGDFPLYTYCAFDVLERCPESRSGPFVGGPDAYANCPTCPIRKWCHAGRDANGDVPLAKVGVQPPGAEAVDRRDWPTAVGPAAGAVAGHYAIDSLIQKVKSVSLRVFEADYLCSGPRADGIWFKDFDEAVHVRESAEHDPALPVWLAIDCGVFTGAVWFQPRPAPDGNHRVTVFASYLSENIGAEANARAILEMSRGLCNGRLDKVLMDPAGGARTAVGPKVVGEYERTGLKPIGFWPNYPGSVADSLAVTEGLFRSADGSVNLTIHPRCKDLVNGLKSFRRARHGGQWMDYPELECHPWEDLVDPLRGGLLACFPEGRKAPARFNRVRTSSLF